MAGKIEIRTSGERFRFVVLNRSGEKLLQSATFDDKSSARRAASSLTKAVEWCRDHRRNQVPGCWDERQQSPRRREGLIRAIVTVDGEPPALTALTRRIGANPLFDPIARGTAVGSRVSDLLFRKTR